jgi:hypothetical protein
MRIGVHVINGELDKRPSRNCRGPSFEGCDGGIVACGRKDGDLPSTTAMGSAAPSGCYLSSYIYLHSISFNIIRDQLSAAYTSNSL